jgi:hypothetical protein
MSGSVAYGTGPDCPSSGTPVDLFQGLLGSLAGSGSLNQLSLSLNAPPGIPGSGSCVNLG